MADTPNPSARQVLLDLADRCEREEPSWELTCAIEAAITPEAEIQDGRPQGGSMFLRVWGKREWRPPSYTTSLDAAVTLSDWVLVHASDIGADGLPLVVLSDTGSPSREAKGMAGRTLILTWCAAALRARAEAL